MPIFTDAVALLAAEYRSRLTFLAQHSGISIDTFSDSLLSYHLGTIFGEQGLCDESGTIDSERGTTEWKAMGVALATCESILLYAHRVHRVGACLFAAAKQDPSQENRLAFGDGLWRGQVDRLWPLRAQWVELLGQRDELDFHFLIGMIHDQAWTYAYNLFAPLVNDKDRSDIGVDLPRMTCRAISEQLPIELAALVYEALKVDVADASEYDDGSPETLEQRRLLEGIEEECLRRVSRPEWEMHLALAHAV